MRVKAFHVRKLCRKFLTGTACHSQCKRAVSKFITLLVHVFKQDVGRLAWALISFAIVVFCCYVRAVLQVHHALVVCLFHFFNWRRLKVLHYI